MAAPAASPATLVPLTLASVLAFAHARSSAAQSACPPLPRTPPPNTKFLPCQVSDSLHWRWTPALAYPTLMASGQIGGGALLQFTVTRTGRVDSTTIKVLKSTHELFVASARSAVAAWRATPARFHGQPVAEVVQHTFLFFPRDTLPCPTHDELGVAAAATVICLPRQKHHGPAAPTPPGREHSLIYRER